ncbi:MAG: hypothetical protein Aurels2KO_55460 [Aureliella sp.]
MTDLTAAYTEKFNVILQPAAEKLCEFLEPMFYEHPGVCRVSTRPKKIKSFLDKAAIEEDGKPKYGDPLNEIQDQLGALVVTRFLADIQPVADIVENTFRRIERQYIEPESENEFGYVGQHYILFLPGDVGADSSIDFFELQVKTLFQYAWSETNHAIGYKGKAKLTPEQRRLSAYLAAQAWGADVAVDDLHSQVGTHSELEKHSA